jgi:hypothetical protein
LSLCHNTEAIKGLQMGAALKIIKAFGDKDAGSKKLTRKIKEIDHKKQERKHTDTVQSMTEVNGGYAH